MISNKNIILFTTLLFFCLMVLLSAYFIEYHLNHSPCNLCLIERIPYIVTIILTLLVLIFKKYEKITLITIGILFIFGAITSFYHFGIEQGFFNESFVCDLTNGNKVLSTKDLLKELESKNVSCKDVTFRVLGLSLATFNTIISLIISVIVLKKSINYEKN